MSKPERMIDTDGKVVFTRHFEYPSFTVNFPMEVPIGMEVLPKGSRVQFLCEGHVLPNGNLMVENSRIIDMNKEVARCYIEEDPSDE